MVPRGCQQEAEEALRGGAWGVCPWGPWSGWWSPARPPGGAATPIWTGRQGPDARRPDGGGLFSSWADGVAFCHSRGQPRGRPLRQSMSTWGPSPPGVPSPQSNASPRPVRRAQAPTKQETPRSPQSGSTGSLSHGRGTEPVQQVALSRAAVPNPPGAVARLHAPLPGGQGRRSAGRGQPGDSVRLIQGHLLKWPLPTEKPAAPRLGVGLSAGASRVGDLPISCRPADLATGREDAAPQCWTPSLSTDVSRAGLCGSGHSSLRPEPPSQRCDVSQVSHSWPWSQLEGEGGRRGPFPGVVPEGSAGPEQRERL